MTLADVPGLALSIFTLAVFILAAARIFAANPPPNSKPKPDHIIRPNTLLQAAMVCAAIFAVGFALTAII